jgi:hypothetical protein
MSIAKEMERYTLSSSSNGYEFILISSSGEEFKNLPEKKALIEYTSSLIEGCGYECSIVDIDGMDQKSAEKAIDGAVKGAEKHILLDINPTKMVVSDKSIILKVSRLEENNYRQNLEYAKSVKAGIKDKELVVHIISDDKQGYYQGNCEKCLRLELWDGIDGDNARKLISTMLSSVIE